MARPPDTARNAAPHTWAVALAGAMTLAVAMGIGRFAFTPLLPLMMRDGQIDAAGGAALAAANYLGYLVGALSAGWLARRPLGLVRACLPLIAGLTAAAGLGHGLLLWSGLRFGAGVCSAWALVGISSWSLSLLAQRGQGVLGGWVFTGVGAGIVLAGLMAWAGAGLSADALWLALGGAALLLALAVGALLPRGQAADANAATHPATAADAADTANTAGTTSTAGTADAARAADVAAAVPGNSASASAQSPGAAAGRPASAALPRGSWPLVVCYGSFGFGYIMPATFLPAMARTLLDDPRSFGLVWPVFGLAAMASTVLSMRWIGRWPPLRAWSVCQFAMAVGVALPLASRSGGAIALAALLVGGTFVLATVIAMQQARALAPAQPARLLGRMTAAFALGQLAGPLAVRALAGVQWGRWAGIEITSAAAAVWLLGTAVWLWRGQDFGVEGAGRAAGLVAKP